VFEGIWGVLVCPMRMVRIWINGDCESKGNWITRGLPEKMAEWVLKGAYSSS